MSNMINKIKEHSKVFTASAVMGTTALLLPFASFAEGTTAAATIDWGVQADTIVANMTSTLNTVAPKALTLVGAVLAVTFGYKIIKKFVKA